MANVIDEILEWVSRLEFWEQAAFDLLLSSKDISDKEIDRLVNFLLEDNNLSTSLTPRPDLHFKEYLASRDESKNYKLNKIQNLQNINALAPDQTLEFGPNLTAIFGTNGSGKSGYSRVLASAGYTRGDEEIIPNITKPYNPDLSQFADIEMEYEGEKILFKHKIGNPCPQLSSYYIFDSTSVIVHLAKENIISFSPSGLSYLRKLAELTDQVRDKLKQQIDAKKTQNNYDGLFQGDSQVKRIISQLSCQTEIDSLRLLAKITTDDIGNLKKLKTRITTIETEGTSSKLNELEQHKIDLNKLIVQIGEINNKLSKEKIDSVNKDITNFNKYFEVVTHLGLKEFETNRLLSAGSPEWHNFIDSARSLANIESLRTNQEYPQSGSYCLLCQQPLSDDAQKLFSQLWGYLESEARAGLRDSENTLNQRLSEYSKIDFGIFDDQLAVTRFVLERKPDFYNAINLFIKYSKDINKLIVENITSKQKILAHGKTNDLSQQIEEIIKLLDVEMVQWQTEVDEVESLKSQKLEYEHREILSNHLADIERDIEALIWIDSASKIGGSTKQITHKYNQLFSKLVTSEYFILFEKKLEELGRPLKVKIATRASKSDVLKHLVFVADESTPERLTHPEKILSEGEKRAVALADFLTEAQLDTSCRGVILDDPVTSLDLGWRKKIAELLVKEAKNRQVIVFTHEMSFLYFLCQMAKSENVQIDNHWIKRGDLDDLPGYVWLNNSPAMEQDYRNSEKAKELHKKALSAQAEDQLYIVTQGFGLLRTCYEVLIIFEVFNGVVTRFDDQVKFMNLKSIVWDDEIVKSIVAKCESLSRYIDGHSHSDAYGGEPPTPALLKKEIDDYDSLRTKVRNLKNKQNKVENKS